MKDLLSLTKRENCFYTVDGITICTIKELHDYVMNCDPNAYSHHTSDGRNDFASWIRDVLMFNDLSKRLFGTKSIDEARIEIKNFTETFEHQIQKIPEAVAFVTIDDYKLKNIQELYYYLINCDDANYLHHVGYSKNDFAKWIGDVWALPTLSQRMFLSTNKMEMINLLKDFLINGQSNNTLEYNKYQSERELSENQVFTDGPNNALNNISNNTSNNMLDNNSQNTISQTNEASNLQTPAPIVSQIPTQSMTQQSIINNPVTVSVNSAVVSENIIDNRESIKGTIHNTVNNKPVVGGIQNLDYTAKQEIKQEIHDVEVVSDNGEEKIVLNTNVFPEKEDEPEKKAPPPLFDESNFHSFSDEELEHFSKFSKPDKETAEPSIKIEYLKTLYKELTGMIRELRRAEKDALVADLILRSIGPKIDYYALTMNQDDYNHIIRIMKEVQKEIEEASVVEHYNLAEEIFKELRLQGLAMKKA